MLKIESITTLYLSIVIFKFYFYYIFNKRKWISSFSNIRSLQDGFLPPHYCVHPIGGFHFASAEKVRSRLISLKYTKKVPNTDVRLENLTIIPDGISNGAVEPRRAANVLVVHCDALCRLDYTFLQVCIFYPSMTLTY